MKRNYRLYLKDILSAMKAIEKFVEGMELKEFTKDDLISSAVIRKFEIIGEATKQISQDIKRRHPGVPWKEMAGMRDKLIHAYLGINYILVWDTVKQIIPQIKPLISDIVKKKTH